MNLYLKNRLHRDVNINNILLGKKADGSNPDLGYRGFLIDLYMTIHIKRDINMLSSERRTVRSPHGLHPYVTDWSSTGFSSLSLNCSPSLLQR
jgi:hypothetical protein